MSHRLLLGGCHARHVQSRMALVIDCTQTQCRLQSVCDLHTHMSSLMISSCSVRGQPSHFMFRIPMSPIQYLAPLRKLALSFTCPSAPSVFASLWVCASLLLRECICCQDWLDLQEMQHQLDRHQSRVRHVEAALHKVSVGSCSASFGSLPHELMVAR